MILRLTLAIAVLLSAACSGTVPYCGPDVEPPCVNRVHTR